VSFAKKKSKKSYYSVGGNCQKLIWGHERKKGREKREMHDVGLIESLKKKSNRVLSSGEWEI